MGVSSGAVSRVGAGSTDCYTIVSLLREIFANKAASSFAEFASFSIAIFIERIDAILRAQSQHKREEEMDLNFIPG